VSYQVGDGEPVSITGTSPVEVSGLPIGTVVTFVVQNAYGAQKTLTGTAGTDSKIDAADEAFTWADYLGNAVDGAYEIDNLAELKLFQKGIAIAADEVKLATAGETVSGLQYETKSTAHAYGKTINALNQDITELVLE
jgi:hypothetical protein